MSSSFRLVGTYVPQTKIEQSKKDFNETTSVCDSAHQLRVSPQLIMIQWGLNTMLWGNSTLTIHAADFFFSIQKGTLRKESIIG